MLRLYNAALTPLKPVLAACAAWPRRDPRKRREWAERSGRLLPVVPPGGIWFHGASVGEARIVSSLAGALRARRPEMPLAASATTPTGRAQLPDPPAVDAAFHAPLDLPGLPRRVLAAVRPAALVLVETELWPNLIHDAAARGVPVVLLNGRLSAGRMARYRRLGRLYRPLMSLMARLGAQSAEDAERMVELGARPGRVEVTGSVKYDLALPEPTAQELRRQLGLPPDRPVFVAGSTGPGEEPLVLEAYRRARAEFPDLLLILAPRHPARIDEVESAARIDDLRVGRLSSDAERTSELEILLVDTLGQLAALYQLARVAFVGGSLVPLGGHNVLEPAAVGVPVLFGPHTESAVASTTALLDSGGARRVANAADLGVQLVTLLGDAARRDEMAARAAEVMRANRGALKRSIDLLLETLEPVAEVS